MNKRFIVIGIALLISVLFLFYVIKPNNGFNLIFYSIHELISPGGKGEFAFIRTCDILFSILIFFLSYKLIKIFFNRNRK